MYLHRIHFICCRFNIFTSSFFGLYGVVVWHLGRHIENARKVLDEMPKRGWWTLILVCQEIEYCFQIYSLFGALYVMVRKKNTFFKV